MTNSALAKAFQFLGALMELHGENPFKIRSYQNAYLTLRKLEVPVASLPDSELEAIKGVGTAIAAKIKELIQTGRLELLEKYKKDTPSGIQELLQIKGVGPKKIQVIWKTLGIESVGELLYAIHENRLLELKGFGEKTQEELRKQLEFYQKSSHQFLYATLEEDAMNLLKALRLQYPEAQIEWTGALRRRMPTLQEIHLLLGQPHLDITALSVIVNAPQWEQSDILGTSPAGFPIRITLCDPQSFGNTQFNLTAAPDFLKAFRTLEHGTSLQDTPTEKTIFDQVRLPYIEPELRETADVIHTAQLGLLPDLIIPEDVQGIVHAHSTYSDGMSSLRDMAIRVKALGYSYLAITDHSKSAFYANGLSVERVLAQMEEIDQLNKELAPFRIFKGIESDILSDGALDYPNEILQQFDVVIASVHSNLKMEEAKATARLIKAIENPYTHILGHPTGRLLLSRPGYPINHRMVIDACAAHHVAIELNANPYRLDVDYSWIPYAIERGVSISINPDAHSREGINDVRFGIYAARKGGLSPRNCLNTLPAEAFANWLAAKY